jgi:hypothetical protein
MWLMQNGMTNPNNAGAGAHHYMHIMGIVALGLDVAADGEGRCGAAGRWRGGCGMAGSQAHHGALLCRADHA